MLFRVQRLSRGKKLQFECFLKKFYEYLQVNKKLKKIFTSLQNCLKKRQINNKVVKKL